MRRIKPIDHEEPLPVVDHLDELRSAWSSRWPPPRGSGSPPGVATVLGILTAPLPGDLEPITLGSSEPFVTSR
jgi:hypothetical protein